MLDDQQKLLVKDSWRMVVPIAETAADLFYKRLFELRPDYRAYFKGDLADVLRDSPIRFVGPGYRGGSARLELRKP